jgi:DnaJ domain
MGLFDRLTEGMRTALDRPGTTPPGASLSDRVGLRAWTDENLRNELERRRRARGRSPNGRPAADDELTAIASARRDRMRDRSLSKSFALLELPTGSSRVDVQRAYRSLLRQYHPDRYLGDPDQHASSIALVTSLTDAYLAVLAQFDRR